MTNDKIRCEWVSNDPLDVSYHDTEWGVPVHEDKKHFEFLTLEGAQAGLSWITILRKRENYRKAFDHFNYKKITNYDQKKVDSLLIDTGIIRNRLKIAATIQNAKAFLTTQKEFGSFDRYIWKFINGKQITNSRKTVRDYPVKTDESEIISKDLLKRGFKFIGPTICYSFMQAVGMVNDHEVRCFRYNEVKLANFE